MLVTSLPGRAAGAPLHSACPFLPRRGGSHSLGAPAPNTHSTRAAASGTKEEKKIFGWRAGETVAYGGDMDTTLAVVLTKVTQLGHAKPIREMQAASVSISQVPCRESGAQYPRQVA